jgi:hypothetical protein
MWLKRLNSVFASPRNYGYLSRVRIAVGQTRLGSAGENPELTAVGLGCPTSVRSTVCLGGDGCLWLRATRPDCALIALAL